MNNKDLLKKYHVTSPNLASSLYFNFIYLVIGKITNFNNKKVLDFGGGHGFLKKKIQKKGGLVKIYDIIKSLSEVNSYKDYDFDIIIFCEVLYLLEEYELGNIIEYLKTKKNIKIISVFSSQSKLNKFFAIILGHPDAHDDTKLSPKKENDLLIKNFKKIKSINFYFFKILLLEN